MERELVLNTPEPSLSQEGIMAFLEKREPVFKDKDSSLAGSIKGLSKNRSPAYSGMNSTQTHQRVNPCEANHDNLFTNINPVPIEGCQAYTV